MAPFNQRQIGYIQAIAGRQQHRTLICGQVNKQISSSDSLDHATLQPKALHSDKLIGQGYTGGDVDAKTLLLQSWLLDHASLAFDSRAAHSNSKLEDLDFTNLFSNVIGMGNYTALECFNADVAGYHATGNATPSATGELVRNPELIPSTVRATEDGFLNSTNISFRFTLPQSVKGTGAISSLFPTAAQLGITNTNDSDGITIAEYEKFTKASTADNQYGSTSATAIQTLINQYNANHSMGQDHFEFRWIVWRAKKPGMYYDQGGNSSNLEAVRDGKSFRNPGYDLFMGQTGRKRGFLGYTLNKDLDKNKIVGSPDGEAYSGYFRNGGTLTTNGASFTDVHPLKEDEFTVDDLMTCRINRDDYVVLKDVRFFLGKEHGKSHFEDTLHWDWNDPIETPETNVLTSPTLNNKNYRWHMTLLGTSGGKNPVTLNVSARWTTKMESG